MIQHEFTAMMHCKEMHESNQTCLHLFRFSATSLHKTAKCDAVKRSNMHFARQKAFKEDETSLITSIDQAGDCSPAAPDTVHTDLISNKKWTCLDCVRPSG